MGSKVYSKPCLFSKDLMFPAYLSTNARVELGVHDLQLGADDLQLREDLRQDPDAAGRKIVGASEPLEAEASVEDPAAFRTHPRKKTM